MYIPSTKEEQQAMLEAIGLNSFDELYADVPEEVRLGRPLNLGEAKSEMEVSRALRDLADKNKIMKTVLRGAGAYRHFIPSVVDNLSTRGEFVTAYTPYQAEMSQGILQNIFEYQTMICELTGMDVSNASVYDGATAAGEACVMCRERKANKVLVSGAANPGYIDTIKTYCIPTGMEVEVIPEKDGKTDIEALEAKLEAGVACVYVAQPSYFGCIEDIEAIAEKVHGVKSKLVVGVNPIFCGLFKTPGECGADVAVGEGQPLGMPLGFGGPYLGFMAAKSAHMRKLPGRIVGETVDKDGKRAFVLTLQAREQHIRREKASSSICSNQAWCALRAGIYMSAMGPEGMAETARQCYANAHYLKDGLAELGFEAVHGGEFFHEFVTTCPVDAKALTEALAEKGILAGLPTDKGLLWCATEMNDKADIDAFFAVLKEVLHGL